jgi:hypothetical protein
MKSFKGIDEEWKLFKRAKEKPAGLNGKDLASLSILVPKELRRKIKARARAEGRTLTDLLNEVLTQIFWHENM